MTAPRKFRVWDGEEMHEPPHEYVWDPREGARRVIDASDGRLTCSQSIDGEVLWSTGLTDADGNEVYEGDILESWGKRSVVEWDEYHGRWHTGVSPECTGDFVGNATVIGNCYEDPTVLEEPTS